MADADRGRSALESLGTLLPQDGGAPTRIQLQTSAGKAAMAPVVRALDEHGVEFETVEVQAPTLDDVFLAVTGSHLEGGDPDETEVQEPQE